MFSVHHLGIHVRDLERMIEFYRNAFGFCQVGDTFHLKDSPETDTVIDTPGADVRGALLKAGNTYMELFQFIAPAPVSSDPRRPYDRGYTHFCVDTDDIDTAMPGLKAAGMDFKGRAPVDCGMVKTLYGWDPEGNIIEIQQTASTAGTALANLDSEAGAESAHSAAVDTQQLGSDIPGLL